MKTIKIPTSLDEITIEQYMKYDRILTVTTTEEAKTIGIISVFCDLTSDEVISMDIKDVKEISQQVSDVLQQKAEFKQKFDKYGFIPNLDKMTAGEYIDLDKYLGDVQNAHKAMAILYREIDNKFLDTYSIVPYTNTEERSKEMLKAPVSVYLGAMVFFWNLSKDLLKCTREYLAQESQTAEQLDKALEQNGVGIHQFTQLLEETSLILTEQLK